MFMSGHIKHVDLSTYLIFNIPANYFLINSIMSKIILRFTRKIVFIDKLIKFLLILNNY
jgi:hypothetical protein